MHHFGTEGTISSSCSRVSYMEIKREVTLEISLMTSFVDYTIYSLNKQGFWWKNGGFIEKWGFRGVLVKKSGKSRKEPGI